MNEYAHDRARWLLNGIVVRLLRILVFVRVLALWAKRAFSRRLPALRGRPPPPPKVLGVIVPERPLPTEPELQAIARIVTWAAANGFTLVTLYSPQAGLLTLTVLEKALDWAGAQDDVTLWTGWDAPREWVASQSTLGVALLGPDDAERPLVEIATSLLDSGGTSPSESLGTSSTSLERALEAPNELKRMMERVGGPTSTMDPDILLVFGSVSSLFGYPSWTTRSSEIYSMGALAAITNAKLSASLERYSKTRVKRGK